MLSKLSSFENILRTENPSVFFLQETHFTQKGRINTKHSKKYKIYELLRTEKQRGGLAIGALYEVDPVLISEGDDDIEILVVQIEVNGFPIRCICVWAPRV